MEPSDILDAVNGYREEMISFLERLISIPAVGPLSGGEGEKERSDLIEAEVGSWGIGRIGHHDVPDPNVPSGIRPNLSIDVKGKDSSARIVVIVHMDIVPPGDLSLWAGDPYKMRRENGRLMGRGVEDNGQALTASLFALRALKDNGQSPAFDVTLFLVSDEEETNTKGIGHLLDENLFRRDDLILVPDHGEPEGRVIELREKTLLWVKVTVMGKQCHASMPDLGNNALRASMLFGTEVDRTLHQRFDRTDPTFDHPISSFEPTRKGKGVEGMNVLPGEDVFYMDCRLIPPYTVEEVLSAMREVAASVEKMTGTNIQVEEVFSETTLFPTRPDSRIVTALSGAIKAATGKKSVNGGIGGGTCAALLRNRGHQVAVWETIHNRAHSADEYILVENLMSDCRVITALFMGM